MTEQSGIIPANRPSFHDSNILPIQLPTDGISGVTTRQVPQELHDTDQSHLLRGQGSLSILTEQMGKVCILLERAQFIAQADIELPFEKSA